MLPEREKETPATNATPAMEINAPSHDCQPRCGALLCDMLSHGALSSAHFFWNDDFAASHSAIIVSTGIAAVIMEASDAVTRITPLFSKKK